MLVQETASSLVAFCIIVPLARSSFGGGGVYLSNSLRGHSPLLGARCVRLCGGVSLDGNFSFLYISVEQEAETGQELG